MRERHIFAVVDVEGILDKFGPKLTEKFGFDPTHRNPEIANHGEDIQNGADNLCEIGYDSSEMREIPKYTRLISSVASLIGWEFNDEFIQNMEGHKYLTQTYDLAIHAEPGDILTWWNRTLDPRQTHHVVLWNITDVNTRKYPEGLKPIQRHDEPLSHVTMSMSTVDPKYGFRVRADDNVYTVSCQVDESASGLIQYNLEMLLLSQGISTEDGIKHYPIAKMMVDPKIYVQKEKK
jgi:hypothetical protein